MFLAASGCLIDGSSRHRMKSDDQPDRDVDEEDPVPAEDVRDDAADGRPDEGRQPEHGPEEPEVLAALGRRVKVRDDRERDREDGAAAEALQAAEEDELPHRLAEAAQRPTRSGTGDTAKMITGRRPNRSDSLP